MEFNVRKAIKEDMTQVLALIKELAVFEKEPEAVEVEVSELEREGFGPHAAFTCFVAETAGEIIGMALVYFRFSTWKGRTVHLEDLIVKDRMRSKGAGERLYAEVMKYAFSQGVKRVQWEVLEWNEGAIRFYERTGAKVLRDWHVVHMDETGIQNYIEGKQ